jgi:hypothetical protein
VIDRAREHARELCAPDPGFERRHLGLRLRDGRRVVLRGAELEQDVRVLDVPRELLDAPDLQLEIRALARDDLRLLLVLPEALGERLLLEPVDLGPQFGKVKDAPLAP